MKDQFQLEEGARQNTRWGKQLLSLSSQGLGLGWWAEASSRRLQVNMGSPGKGRDSPCLLRILSLNMQRERKNPPGRRLGSLERGGAAASYRRPHWRWRGNSGTELNWRQGAGKRGAQGQDRCFCASLVRSSFNSRLTIEGFYLPSAVLKLQPCWQ